MNIIFYKGLYYPNYSSFNNKFFLDVLGGRKRVTIILYNAFYYNESQLLPLGSIGGYLLPYYTKERVLTKQVLFQEFIGDDELLKYLPDNPKLATIPREFLLSILANVKREKYAKLYTQYKQIKVQRSTVGNKIYKAQITNEFSNGLKNFAPINL